MYEQRQYDAWVFQLSEFFIKKFGYQIVAMPKERTELWLVNPKQAVSKIIMISSKRTDDFDMDSIMLHRNSLASVFQIDTNGLNISVNQESMFSDLDTVIVGPMSHSVSETFNHFEGIQTVLKPSRNPVAAMNHTYKALARHSTKLRKQAQRRLTPTVSVISAICIFMFAVMVMLQSFLDISLSTAVIMMGAYYKPYIVGLNEWHRLFVSGFIHLNLIHILFNLMALRSIGSIAEPVLGKRRFLIILFSGIIFGNVFVFIRNEASIGVGLSGGIFALLGWLIVYFIDTGAFKNPRLRNDIVVTLMLNLYISMLPGVSFMAHLGGFVVGVIFGVIYSKNAEWAESRRYASFMLAVFSGVLVYLMSQNMYFDYYKDLNIHVAQAFKRLGFDSYAERILNTFK